MAWSETTREKYKRISERYESDLTDGEWALIKPLLPPPPGLGRPRSTDLREVLDAIQYMPATGCQWRAVPRCSAPFATVQGCFHAWRGSGVMERMMDALRGLARDRAGRGPEPTAAGTGSQSVRTTETAGPSGHHAGKRTRGRKRHIAVDVEGTPDARWCSPRHWAHRRGRGGDPDRGPGPHGRRPGPGRRSGRHPGDAREGAEGDGTVGRQRLQRRGTARQARGAGCPRGAGDRGKTQGNQGFTVLYRRWVVDGAFAWMSRCRRLAKDCGRSLASSVAWAQLAACRFLFRRLARDAST